MSDRQDLWVKDGGLRLDLRYVALLYLYLYLCDQSPLPPTSEASCVHSFTEFMGYSMYESLLEEKLQFITTITAF